MRITELLYWFFIVLALTFSNAEFTFDSGGKDEARIQVQTKKETTNEVQPSDGPKADWK